ncbi:MAG: mechanosensitive ion channel family protein [Rhodanobacteraceae bacterium]|jgi:small-conductance mechanosensitive channel|nr:mechanosensitive ion channel family protein [Rhodanobacteraceae bacterium]
MSLFRVVFTVLLALASLRGLAQEQDPARFFDDARAQVADIRKQLGGEVDDAQLTAFRDAVAALATRADALATDRAPRLAALDARIAELGEAPAKGAPAEAADITAQRNALGKERAALDAEIKRARLLAVDAQQLSGEITEARRANFQARLTRRTATPLSPTFWRELGGNLERDGARLAALRDGLVTALRDAFAPDNRSHALAGLGLGLLLIVLGRWAAERALLGLTAGRMPQGRLRRSAHAVAVVAVATLFTGGGAQAIVSGLDWHEAFSGAEKAFARALVGAVFFGSFVTGLGRALLSARRPSWRLAPIDDAIAARLRLFPLLVGVLVALSQLAKQVNSLVAASLSATILTSLVVAVLYSVLIGWGLLRTADARGAAPADDGAVAPPRRTLWVGLGIAALWLGVLATLFAAVFGYIALANQIARQMVGVGIIVSAFYLLVHLVEDLCASALSSRAEWAEHALGLEPRVLDQLAVLCSGAFRVCAVLLALAAALLPFGTGPADLLARLGQAGTGLKIGQIEVTPGAVVSALAVFVFGLVAIRALQRWLREHYLPTTRLEPAMRSSVTTLLGYAGGVVVFAFALSALGLSVERIAWVASALSVGIGFGLQAIVQNFVSGLILLVERPVKVGDWVVLGDTEGDIRRINVRATEIQMADRSTVIVPNSELITKSVRNVTLANAEGRVRIRLPMPLGSDADRVREILFAAFAAHPGVLKTPTPSVLLDGIEGGTMVFIAVAYVTSPRQSSTVRSELLFDILARLRAHSIALSRPVAIQLRNPDDDG